MRQTITRKWMGLAFASALVLVGCRGLPAAQPVATANAPAGAAVATTAPAIQAPSAVTETVSNADVGAAINMTVGETAMVKTQFSTFVQLVVAAGITNTFLAPDPVTIFAPTDDAFAKLPKGTLDDLAKPENKDKLVKILTYHLVVGEVIPADALKGMTSVKTAEGSDLTIATSGDALTVNGATIIEPDTMATNGVIHGIDTVLIPPDAQ